MKYKITSKYCYHEGIIVDMYFINGVPFTFDDIPTVTQDDPYVQIEAEESTDYTTEDNVQLVKLSYNGRVSSTFV